MTRKKFIKFLMSIGISRNDAREYSAIIIDITKRFEGWNKVRKLRGSEIRFPPPTYANEYRRMRRTKQ